MPTRAEMKELIDRCTITNEIVNGVDGFRVKGPNGNSIFMPASGYKDYSYHFSSDDSQDNRCGFYWSSEPYNSNTSTYAYSLIIGTDGTRSITKSSRWLGYAIRPVANKDAILGDMDGNGQLTVSDVSILVDIILNTKDIPKQDILRGDMNGDGNLTVSDISKLVDIILGNQ